MAHGPQLLSSNKPTSKRVFKRGLISAIAVIALLGGPSATAPAQAQSGALFEKIAGILVQFGTDPDQIEAARYTINEPTHASIVYSHAVAQDYPFFALVGAAKAARKNGLGPAGPFTQAKCEMPITAIDLVFGKADQYIDNSKGKADTNRVTGAAADYAAYYAKAQTEAAKEEVVNQLSENIPYFGEIKTICSFAFNTNFKAEKDVFNAVGGITTKIVSTYDAFKNGEYVTGVATLISLGASPQIACSFVDGAIESSLIGRTPILSDLAKGACSSFVGKIIDGGKGIIMGGVGLAEAGVNYLWEGGKVGVCKVYSLIGGACSSAPPPPDAATQFLAGATNYCAPHGGLGAASINSGGVRRDPISNPQAGMETVGGITEYSFNCNNGTKCRKKSNGVVQCVTATEIAARNAQLSQLLQTDLSIKLPQWRNNFNARWMSQCPFADGNCMAAFKIIASGTEALIKQDAAKSPYSSYYFIAGTRLRNAEAEAASALENARFSLLPIRWGVDMDQRAANQCLDQQCRDEIKTLKETILQVVAGQHKMKPKAPYSTMSFYLSEGDKTAREYVVNSKVRASNRMRPSQLPTPPVAPKPGQPIKIPGG